MKNNVQSVESPMNNVVEYAHSTTMYIRELEL